MHNDDNRPKVGVGALVFKDGKILLGKRKGTHGTGSYSSGGGHVEHLESLEEAIRREIREENGVEVTNLRFLCVVNLKEYAPKHYLDIGFIADWQSGEPTVLEPDKFESWDWYSLDNLPKPLFAAIPRYLEALKTGQNYFDA